MKKSSKIIEFLTNFWNFLKIGFPIENCANRQPHVMHIVSTISKIRYEVSMWSVWAELTSNSFHIGFLSDFYPSCQLHVTRVHSYPKNSKLFQQKLISNCWLCHSTNPAEPNFNLCFFLHLKKFLSLVLKKRCIKFMTIKEEKWEY